ncbi:hypothetical protein K439DRAFT_1618784 [Ramaria rubella]|nr:hypothetical protein K439DRAFT_1618784 [Ramaria rubella]
MPIDESDIEDDDDIVDNSPDDVQCMHCTQSLLLWKYQRLQKLLELSIWYNAGNSIDAEHYREHIELTCTLHEMESHPLMIRGWALRWPTTLDAIKIRTQICLMKELCHEVFVHAWRTEQFLGILELLDANEPDLVDPPPTPFFGEQGLNLITETLEGIYLDEGPIEDCIKPLTRETFICHILAYEVTVKLICDRENLPRSEASLLIAQSCIWGGVHLPEVSGAAGEDVDVEHRRMTVEQKQHLKGKGVDRREWTQMKVKEEEKSPAPLPGGGAWKTFIDCEGREVTQID